ncbi:MAG: hypothetical protein D6737_17265 [Chloroflexi bacterium]|nr:MAG: hypothetical protein D6737_17265 [Chloroflexota bacterium]
MYRLTIRHLIMTGMLLLVAACSAVSNEENLPTLVPSNTPLPAPSQTPVPVDTATPLATTTPEEPPVVITLDATLGEAIDPPLTIDLPAGWDAPLSDILLLNDIGDLRGIPFTVYSGPVTGGTGNIVLLWGFPNLTPGNPFEAEAAEVDLWADGLRLLRLAIVEQGCNIGTDLRRSYRVGLLPAVGTQFAAVDCPELADTRGWFAGVQEGGINFVFYMFTDPIEAMDVASEELQAIIDTVRFDVPEAPLVTPEPEIVNPQRGS